MRLRAIRSLQLDQPFDFETVVSQHFNPAAMRELEFYAALRIFGAMPRLQFAVMGIAGPILATWLLIGVVSLVIEVIPEHILVD